MTNMKDRMMGSFLGLIVGDSYGQPWEFLPRDSYTVSPDMQPNENFQLAKGSFTDDSSMMMCLAESLAQKNTFDWQDQMERYLLWRTDGYLSVNGKCFDVGRTISMSLSKYLFWQRTGKTMDGNLVFDDDQVFIGVAGAMNAGNGSIMRLAPIPIFYHYDIELAKKYARLSSQITHATPECTESAALLAEIIVKLLNGGDKESSLICNDSQFSCQKVKAIAMGEYKKKSRDEIQTSGYVIHTLEAALWGFYKYHSFEIGAIVLAGMGMDVDTVLAVYGSIAGSFYGVSSIPRRWINDLQKKEMIQSIMTPFLNLIIKNK